MNAPRLRVLFGSVSVALAAVASCTEDDAPTTSPIDAGSTLDVSVADVARSETGAVDVAVEASPDAAASDAATDGGESDATSDGGDDAPADAADAATLGQALAFDGVDDIVTMSGDPSETAFSAELWFKMAALGDGGFATQGNMFEVWQTAAGGADRFLFVDQGKACFYVYNPARGNPKLCSTATFNDGAWHHIAGTLGANAGMRVYVDGVEVAADANTTASTYTTANAFRLGYGHYGFSSPFIRMRGVVDEVRVWSVERTGAEIAANYNKTVAPGSAGLQGYWKLDETAPNTVAKDSALLPDGGLAGNDGVLAGFNLDGGASPWVSPGAL